MHNFAIIQLYYYFVFYEPFFVLLSKVLYDWCGLNSRICVKILKLNPIKLGYLRHFYIDGGPAVGS